jgi:hypothetical protein
MNFLRFIDFVQSNMGAARDMTNFEEFVISVWLRGEFSPHFGRVAGACC